VTHYLNHPVVINGLLFLFLIVVFSSLEWRWGARRIPWRTVLLADLLALAFYVLVVTRGANYLNHWVYWRGPWPAAIAEWPFAARLLLYFVVADFGAYWMHRLVHVGALWRVHRWHHSPKHLYWLAGNRGSILQQAIFNLPYIFASPLIAVSPVWLATGLFVLQAITNSWMHMNVRWQLGWLDWLLVTPRSHEIHHSDDPDHYNSNFGVLLSIWDRMFGTFKSPREVDAAAMRFGITDKVPIARLSIGI